MLSDKLDDYREASEDAGYGDVLLAGGNRVEVWWRGPLPAQLQRQVAATKDVLVTVHPAPYTYRQIHAKMNGVDLEDKRIVDLGIKIDAWAMSCGASGLLFTYVPIAEPASAERIRSELETFIGIRVLEVKVAAPALPDGPLQVSPT